MTDDTTVRIAMWSGPRNLSTAMMRAFASRADCGVVDEPFYSPFLAASGLDHPMRAEILARHECDPDKVAAACSGPAPGGEPLFYQKHMTHHMLPGFDLSFMNAARNAFLIREPARVVASYEVKREHPTFEDLGFERQAELFEREADRLGNAPPVVDSAAIASAPEATLRALCAALGIAFDPAMLSWPPGPRPEDGAWGPHWYNAIYGSTRFEAPNLAPPALSEHGRRLAEQAAPFYDALARHAL